MAQSRTKIARELSDEELEKFLAELRAEKNLTGRRLRELARERGIQIGHNSANEFLRKEFEPYLERIQRQSRLATFIEEHSRSGDASKIADAAAGELSQSIFEFVTVADLDVNLHTKDGLKQADALSRMIARLRIGDHRLRLLESRLKEVEAQRAEVERIVDGEAVKKGASLDAQNKIRAALGMAPLPQAA